jgi:predicted PurR-regulated permease PerM
VGHWGLVALALYVVGWLLWASRNAMLPFIIGLVLAYLITPIVNRLDRLMPRPLAILNVYAGTLILLVVAFTFVVPPIISQTQQLIASIPPVDQIQATGNQLLEQYRQNVPEAIRVPLDEGIANALRTAQDNLGTFAQGLGTFMVDQILRVVNTLTFLIGFLIIPFWLFYIINDENQGVQFLNSLLHPRIRPDFWNFWTLIHQVLSGYVRGQLLLGVVVGAAVGAGLLLLQFLGFPVNYILLLAIFAGFTELIPIIGPIIGAIPAVLLALFSSSDPWGTVVAVLLVYIVVQQLENNFLVPRIVGESVGVHPAILTVVLIAMGEVFGLIGVILSAPLAAIARDLFSYTYRRIDGMAPANALGSVIAHKVSVDMNAVNEPKNLEPGLPRPSALRLRSGQASSRTAETRETENQPTSEPGK